MSTDLPLTPDEWASMAPWVQAREWHAAGIPTVGDIVIEMAKERARLVWALEKEERRSAVRRAEEDQAAKLRAQAQEFEHRRALEVKREVRAAVAEKRVWVLQLISVMGALASVGANAVASYLYADAVSLGSGLTVLGAGSALTAAAFVASRKAAKDLLPPAEPPSTSESDSPQ